MLSRRGFLFGTAGALIVPTFIPVIQAAEIIEPGVAGDPVMSGIVQTFSGFLDGKIEYLPMSSIARGIVPHSWEITHRYDTKIVETLGGVASTVVMGTGRAEIEVSTHFSTDLINEFIHENRTTLYLPDKRQKQIIVFPCKITEMQMMMGVPYEY